MPTGGLAGRVEVPSRWFASSQWACSMAWSRSTSSARCSSSCWFLLCSSRTCACSRASLRKEGRADSRQPLRKQTWNKRNQNGMSEDTRNPERLGPMPFYGGATLWRGYITLSSLGSMCMKRTRPKRDTPRTST